MNIFISYRRKDTLSLVGRIHDKLVKEYGEEHVFLDFDTIPLGVNYLDHIKKELSKCDILLLIIGPNWLQSGNEGRTLWGNDDYLHLELKTALDRHIPIIPILVNGAIMPEKEDLPTELNDLHYYQAIAVDVAKDFHSHTDYLIKEINRLKINLQRNNKQKKEEEIETRSKQSAISNFSLQENNRASSKYLLPPILLLIVLGVAIWYLWFKPTTEYYKNFTRSPIGWIGADKITDKQRNYFPYAYVFAKKGFLGRIDNVKSLTPENKCYVNNALTSITGDSLLSFCSAASACEVTMTYSETGGLLKEDIKDQFGNNIESVSYSSESANIERFGFKCPDESLGNIRKIKFSMANNGLDYSTYKTMDFLDSNGNPSANSKNIDSVRYEYDLKGRVVDEKYYRSSPQKVLSANSDGVAEQSYEYDENGNIKSITYSGLNESLINKVRYDYSDQEKTMWNISPEGESVWKNDGINSVKFSFDKNGNMIKKIYQNELGSPVVSPTYGFAITQYIFDEQGNNVEQKFLDEKGQPINSKMYLYSSLKSEYKNKIEYKRTFWGSDGKAVLNNDGVHGWEREVGNRGMYLQYRNFDIDNETISPDTEAAPYLAVKIIQTDFKKSDYYSTDSLGVAISGYDPTSYFERGYPAKGTAKYYALYDGAIWLFSSKESLQKFKEKPSNYIPEYGGFCASCILSGKKHHSDPHAWAIHENKLYLFYDDNGRNFFIKNTQENASLANYQWNTLKDKVADNNVDLEISKIASKKVIYPAKISEHIMNTGFTINSSISSDSVGIAILGYDPVSYIINQSPIKGSAQYFSLYDGAIWFFASNDNKTKFDQSPKKYIPAYGGFCAWCVYTGHKVHSDPNVWFAVNGKTYLHLKDDYKNSWLKNPREFIEAADKNWNEVKKKVVDPEKDHEVASSIKAVLDSYK